MKILWIDGHDFHYEMENLCRVFFPEEAIRTEYGNGGGENDIVTSLQREERYTIVSAAFFPKGSDRVFSEQIPNSHPDYEHECERKMAVALFHLLSEIIGAVPPWGILTGVRPAKLMHKLIRETGSLNEAKAYFKNRLLVSKEKTELAAAVARTEEPLLALSKPDSFSLYISIPFCPTRCSYCSFVSHSIAGAKKLIPEYVRLLCEEIRHTGAAALTLGLKLETVYMGGGTPTSLEPEALAAIMETVEASFDLSGIREYTVEAGRPDTITPEKLSAVRRGKAARISINPQTFDDKILETIGRRHTSLQTLEGFRLARKMEFSNINMDLIAGLPGDMPEQFESTLAKTLALSPESITVHTLALKRASRLVTDSDEHLEVSGGYTSEMLRMASKTLLEQGYHPYYLYRQSKTVGNLENVGWCKPGYECLYNVYMMGEIHTVLAVGAGAVSKLRESAGEKIERIFNFKYPYEYIRRFPEILERKSRMNTFYEEYNIEKSR